MASSCTSKAPTEHTPEEGKTEEGKKEEVGKEEKMEVDPGDKGPDKCKMETGVGKSVIFWHRLPNFKN